MILLRLIRPDSGVVAVVDEIGVIHTECGQGGAGETAREGRFQKESFSCYLLWYNDSYNKENSLESIKNSSSCV